MVFINKFLFSYGYGSVTALMQSMFPSTKYVGVGHSLALSSFWGLVCSWLGLWPMLALAMLTVMAVELVSGIVASHVRKEHFESAKFLALHAEALHLVHAFCVLPDVQGFCF